MWIMCVISHTITLSIHVEVCYFIKFREECDAFSTIYVNSNALYANQLISN